MKSNNLRKNDFFNSRRGFNNETAEEFLRQFGNTQRELREAIAYLIEHREMIRDAELERLEQEARKLIEELKNIDQQKLVEEIECFKDILALQKRLIQNNGKPRH